MSLAAHIQAVRKLKPFLDASASLLAIAEVAESSEQTLARNEAKLAEVKAVQQLAQADADGARAFATDHIAKAKTEADEIVAKANAVLADANARAKRIEEAAIKSNAEVMQAVDRKVDERKAEVEAREKVLASINEQITKAEAKLAEIRQAIAKIAGQ